MKDVEERESNLFNIEFYIGNNHEIVKDPYKQREHRWTLFVICDQKQFRIQQFVEKVEFRVWKKRQNFEQVVLTEPPF